MDSPTHVIFAISVIMILVIAFTDPCRKRLHRGRDGDREAGDD
jgi:hypothetical protein